MATPPCPQVAQSLLRLWHVWQTRSHAPWPLASRVGVFTYGILQDFTRGVPAQLDGWRRFQANEVGGRHSYTVILPDPDAMVEGCFFPDITQEELAAWDVIEGVARGLYYRHLVHVVPIALGHTGCWAHVYVPGPATW